jgi:hypothetical protein
VRAIAYGSVPGEWALSGADLFPDRGALVPSPPAIAVYLGSSALIAWEAGGQLYTRTVPRGVPFWIPSLM